MAHGVDTLNAALGIDVGGTGIKGALVDLDLGELHTDRIRIRTPQPATPEAVAATIAEIATQTGWTGPRLGCALPSVVKDGIVRTAANIDAGWIDFDAQTLIASAVGTPVTLLNDADAAGMAEMRYGAGRGEQGVVLLLTFGTGIGSAVFAEGMLVPNTELGHLQIDGVDAEVRASAKVQEEEGLTYPEWTARVNRYLHAVEAILWPDLIVIGGGISKDHAEFLDLLEARARIVPATLRNHAGIIGAALACKEAT
ncbi:MAG: ROK family protein [Acidimicrobiia bacterium]